MYILCRTSDDPVLKYIYEWAIPPIRQINDLFIDVRDTKYNKKNVTKLLKRDDYKIIWFQGGHGGYDRITGYQKEPIIVALDNDYLLKNKEFVYALSCKTARVLGVSAFQQGCKFYLGYLEKFVFVNLVGYENRPLQDPIAKPFMEASNTVIVTYMKTRDAIQSYKKSQEVFNYYINKYMFTKEEKTYHLVPFLSWDKRNQVLVGYTTIRNKVVKYILLGGGIVILLLGGFKKE